MLPRRPRRPDFDYLGKHRYFLTFCTNNRRAVFTRADTVAIVWWQILRAAGVAAHVKARKSGPTSRSAVAA